MRQRMKILCRKFEPFERITRLFFDNYAQTHPSQLELELVPLPLPELHAEILKGDFDIAHVNTDWLSECWQGGALCDLRPYIDASPPEDYPHGWHESLLKLQTFEDGVAGIPFHDGPECLIYRSDLFSDENEREAYYQRYGSELKPPGTWEEFEQAAAHFNRPGMYGTLFALYPDGHNNIFDFALQVWSRGGSLVDERGALSLNTPMAVEAMKYYRHLISQDYVHADSKDFESIAACMAFARGEAAMMVNWFGFATMCETEKESKVKGCVDIAPVPREGGADPVSLNVYYTWSVSAKSALKQQAYDFIKNAVSRENDLHLPLMGAVGCRLSTWSNEEVNRVIPYYNRMADIHAYAKTLPRIPQWHGVSVVIDELVLRVTGTDEPVESILEQAQKKADSVLNTPAF